MRHTCLGLTNIYQIRIPGVITQGIVDSYLITGYEIGKTETVDYVKQLHLRVTTELTGLHTAHYAVSQGLGDFQAAF